MHSFKGRILITKPDYGAIFFISLVFLFSAFVVDCIALHVDVDSIELILTRDGVYILFCMDSSNEQEILERVV
jgi:hypothetical protein